MSRREGGAGGGVIGVLIGMLVTILVGVIVVTSLIGSVNSSAWSAEAQGVWTTLQANVWVAFSLLVILPIVIGAVALMRYMGVFGG